MTKFQIYVRGMKRLTDDANLQALDPKLVRMVYYISISYSNVKIYNMNKSTFIKGCDSKIPTSWIMIKYIKSDSE